MSLEVGLEVAVVLEYLQFGKLDRAKRTLEPLLVEHAQHPEVLRAQSRLAWAEGNEASAIDLLKAAVGQQDGSTTWASELATLYVQTSRWHEAEQLLSGLMQSEPSEPAHVMNLAVVLLSSARTAEAMTLVDRAQTLGADFKAVAINRASILRNWGNAREAASLLRQVIEANPNDIAVKARLSGTVLYDSEETPETVRDAMVDLGRCLERTVPKIYRKASGDPEKRLRIGYVSPDLRAHSVAAFLEPLFKHHDRSQVEVFGIMCNATEDAVTERLKALSDGWVNASKLSDDALSAWIREAGIDVLVDLAGYTEGTRIQIFASRPAPVQVSYLGFPATTGLTTVMGRIGDSIADGPLSDAHFVEPMQRLERVFLAYQPQSVSPEVDALPFHEAGHFTFGSFNALPKISAATVRLWSAVLLAVPGSRMLIKTKGLDDPTVAEHLLNRFAELGIEAGRIDLAPQTQSIEEHLGLYGKVDIALDTIPYNGTTTTCESLWMGVPVFTVLGEMHHERVSASILNAVGLPEFVGETPEDMVNRVVSCCADITALATLRASLRSRVSSSPLCDGAGLARQIESVYRKLWIQALERDV